MRWHGPLDDILRATREADGAIEGWTGHPPTYTVEIQFRNGLVQEDNNLEAIANLSERDISRVRQIELRVIAARQPDNFFVEHGRVFFRVEDAQSALFVMVTSDDRARVEGLAQRLEDMLKTGARFPPVPSEIITGVVVGLLGFAYAPAVLLAISLIWTLGWAAQNNKWDPAEIAVFPITLIVFAGVGILVHWLTPNLHLLSEGAKPRWDRFYKLGASMFVGILISVIGSFIYGIATGR
jgi:hypothetical protein